MSRLLTTTACGTARPGRTRTPGRASRPCAAQYSIYCAPTQRFQWRNAQNTAGLVGSCPSGSRIAGMRILLVGAGGVGTAFARIAARRPFAELIVADYDLARAQHAAAASDRFTAVQLDANDEAATTALLTERSCDALMNATDPRFVMPLFRAALAAGVDYLDMAMSLSQPHPTEPYAKTGVKLGDEQFAMADKWEQAGKLALAGIGVEP